MDLKLDFMQSDVCKLFHLTLITDPWGLEFEKISPTILKHQNKLFIAFQQQKL
jgi:hypothetical protein